LEDDGGDSEDMDFEAKVKQVTNNYELTYKEVTNKSEFKEGPLAGVE
jgi:hypothetical protein